jgi:hypothetical protein
MAWRIESVIHQRLCFIAAWPRADEPMSGLCSRVEIGRNIGCKRLSRYLDFEAAWLAHLSPVRHMPAQAMDPAITYVTLNDDARET